MDLHMCDLCTVNMSTRQPPKISKVNLPGEKKSILVIYTVQ